METWREIVEEMREIEGDRSHRELCGYADQIESACNTLEAENAKLRRALEPVMKCDITENDSGWKDAWKSLDAVREAQAIMKEGAE